MIPDVAVEVRPNGLPDLDVECGLCSADAAGDLDRALTGSGWTPEFGLAVMGT